MSEESIHPGNTETQGTRPLRLFVFPRLDVVSPELCGTALDEVLQQVKIMEPEIFPGEEAATEFYYQHLTTHIRPVYRCSLSDHAGSPFPGPPFSRYHTAPAETGLPIEVAFVLDDPIRCTLGDDWQYRTIELSVKQKPSHKTVRRYPKHPHLELLEAVNDLESELYAYHGARSLDALSDFWSSFEVHRHITEHALKMQRHKEAYDQPVSEALDFVREHLMNYVEDCLTPLADVDAQGLARKSDVQLDERATPQDQPWTSAESMLDGPKPDLERLIEEKEYIILAVAARYLERHPDHVRRLVREKKILRVGQGRPIKISSESLRKYKRG